MDSPTSQKAALRAGAAQVDITPHMGIQLGGDIGRHRPAELVNDPLHARALVLEAGGRQLCLLSLETCIITRELTTEIRRLATRQFGLDPAAVMIHALQIHSAPSLGYEQIRPGNAHIPPTLDWLRAGDERYHNYALPRILEAMRRALATLAPVWMGAASGIEGRVAFNRRFVMRGGTVRTHPSLGDPNILYAEGPVDPELGVLCFTSEDLSIPAMLLHFTCHPCHGYPHRYISADWPGEWARGIQNAYGERVVPLVYNGCCGNIHHTNHLDTAWISEYRRMAGQLTESTHPVLKRIRYQREAVLDWRTLHLAIPIREPAASDLDAARTLLAQHPNPIWLDEEHTRVDWAWVYAVSLLELDEERRREPCYDYEIQAFRIDDVAILGLPGEVFVEAQLRIKKESPAYRTFIGHNCTDSVGYIPTQRAFVGGGYETRTAQWSKLAPQALEMIEEGALQLLNEMF